MRTFFKIFLLAAAIGLMTVLLVSFAKTRLDPPRTVKIDNPHEDYARTLVKAIGPTVGSDALNRRFFRARHLIGFLDDNHLLSAEQSDVLKEQMMERYTPAYSDWCMRCFKAPTWYAEELKQMKRDIALMRKVTKADGTSIADSDRDMSQRLDDIIQIVARHDSAQKLVRICREMEFDNFDWMSSRIEKGKRFQKDAFLRNNVKLRQQLDSVPVWLEMAHFKKLEFWVHHMKDCMYMDEEEYDEQHQRVADRLDDYEDRAYSVYGRTHSVSALRRILKEYHEEYDSEHHSVLKSFIDLLSFLK